MERISMAFHMPRTTMARTEAYEFRPTGRLKRLKQFLFDWMRKGGDILPRYEERVDYRRVEVDSDRLIERIRMGRELLWERGGEAKDIFIGPEEFSELVRDRDVSSLIQQSPRTAQFSIAGLRVKIVPHMKGVLVL